jgi:hypothetical protein
MIHSIASTPSEASGKITAGMKHPVFHRWIDERPSGYHSIGQALKDREDRKSRRKWAAPPDALESAGGHESEIGQREFSTERKGRINLAVQWALVR